MNLILMSLVKVQNLDKAFKIRSINKNQLHEISLIKSKIERVTNHQKLH